MKNFLFVITVVLLALGASPIGTEASGGGAWRNLLGNWDDSGTTWTGSLPYKSNQYHFGPARLWATPVNTDHYVVTSRVHLDKNGCGHIFKYKHGSVRDQSHVEKAWGYFFWGGKHIYITSSGREGDPRIDFTFNSGSWYNLKSDVKGTHVTIFVNDNWVRNVTMSGSGADAKRDNYVGLWCHDNIYIKGDSFDVQALDKCQSPELNDCHEKANCTNTPDSYSCTCLDGYAGDGVHCEDVNECQALALNKCHKTLARCINTLGSYTCTCLDGYLGDGKRCQDLDECQRPDLNKCHKKATCTNTVGSYNCTCQDGFVGNSTQCQDVNECQVPDLNKCHKTLASCKNTPGSYKCTCLDGYFGNGTQCEDVDECQGPSSLNKCHEKAMCTNTIGSHNCTCHDGYFGNGTHCQDMNECRVADLNRCHEKAKCTNNPGSYSCTCLEGYFGDGIVCQAPPSIYNVDPPKEAGTEENVTLQCHARGLPPPAFAWVTPDGYYINATKSVYETPDDDSQNTRGKKLQKDGSLLVFNTRVHDQGIYKCVAINVMGKDERRVNLTVREDLVEVDAAITLENEEFDKELENKSSVRYQAMEKKVKQELTTIFQDIEGFLRVEILGFVNGSVKAKFRVVVQVVHTENKKPSLIVKKVGTTLRVSVRDGNIGSLKVKPTVELRELPPPPVNLRSRDISQTGAVITWSHPDLHDEYAISGYLLQFKKFRTKKWSQFTTTLGMNHKLTKLEPDTYYLVRLKSENEFGKGKPSENLELQTDNYITEKMESVALLDRKSVV